MQWERLFAALLSVLLKKHLIADWEFVEEYRRNRITGSFILIDESTVETVGAGMVLGAQSS